MVLVIFGDFFCLLLLLDFFFATWWEMKYVGILDCEENLLLFHLFFGCFLCFFL